MSMKLTTEEVQSVYEPSVRDVPQSRGWNSNEKKERKKEGGKETETKISNRKTKQARVHLEPSSALK